MTAEQVAIDFNQPVQTELPFVEELFGRKELQDECIMEKTGIKSEKLVRMMREGCGCPLCGHYLKIYPRSINREMAATIVLVARHFEKYPHSEPLHLEHWLRVMFDAGVIKSRLCGREHGRLTMWGLLKATDSRESKSEKKKVSGNYVVTEKGMAFAQGKISVPKYAYVHNRKVIGFSNELVMIQQCFKTEFNYTELMNTPIP